MAQGKRDISQSFFDGLVNAMDDIRHKVIEEPWFGWGNGRSITGDVPEGAVKNTSPATQTHNTASPEAAATPSPQAEPQNSLVSHETNRPDESGQWWQGEHSGSYDGQSDSHEMRPHNGWDIGQDAAETREALPEQETKSPYPDWYSSLDIPENHHAHDNEQSRDIER